MKLSQGQKMWLATALSSYARRLIARYGVDEFFKTDLGRMLHDLPSFKKHVLETGLHSGAATISYVIPEAGFWGRFFNETLTDVPSEVAKNMMNGLPAGDRESLLKKILSLGEGTVKETVIWAEGLPEEELIAAKKEMERMTAQEIGVLVGSGQADNEFVASPAGHDIYVPDRISEDFGGHFQGFVSGFMAVFVIDDF